MTFLYDLIFVFIALFHLPVYLFKGKFHQGFLMRLGKLPESLPSDGPIWIHAVSVGEALAVRNLVEGLRIQYPSKKFVISTVTATGNTIAATLAKEGDSVIYFPLDISVIVKKAVAKIRPSLFVIAETEIWPNMITCLASRKIPIVVVNGRISDSSFRGYRRIRPLLKPLLEKIDLFCVQTQTDALRLAALGVDQGKVKVTGNMKFDNLRYSQDKINAFSQKFRSILKLKNNERLLVAGSTHPGEEVLLLGVYRALLQSCPDLRLLIAPRHPQRAAEVKQLIIKSGFQPVEMSKLETLTASRDPMPVFILDTVGQLIYLYSLAQVVFVGGSLIKKGGHNILEPAALGKPVFFGPSMFNFRDIADLFLEHKAGLLVHNEEELKCGILDLLRDQKAAQEVSARARELIVNNQGATSRNLEYLKSIALQG